MRACRLIFNHFSSNASISDLLLCVLDYIQEDKNCVLQIVFLLRLAKENQLVTKDFKLELGISSPIIELIKSVNHEADENSPIGQIALAVTFKAPITSKIWPTLFKISHRSEKIRKMVESTVQEDEASEKVLCSRLSEVASGRVSASFSILQKSKFRPNLSENFSDTL